MILNRPILIKLNITISIAWFCLFFKAHSQESPIDQFEINSNFATPWLEEAISELSSIPNAAKDEIRSHRVTLSYIDPLRATQLLSLHGYKIGKPEEAVDPKSLPMDIALPGTTFHEIIPKPEEKFPQTETDPINELIIFHNPSIPSQLSEILSKISNDIDKPARQIMIEAMILEVSETALDELGVKWTKAV